LKQVKLSEFQSVDHHPRRNVHYIADIVLTRFKPRECQLFEETKGTLRQKFFRVVALWNELDDSTVSVYNVTAFKRML